MPSSLTPDERLCLVGWAEMYAMSGNPQAKIALWLLKEYDNLLDERDKILDELPCPQHGQCVPHVIAFIQKAKVLIAALQRIIERSKGSGGEPALSPVEAAIVVRGAGAGDCPLPK